MARYYVPDRIVSCTFPARFEWDSTHGVKTFRPEDSALGDRVGGGTWRYLVAAQIRPRLDTYLRRGKIQRASGYALVSVARVIPIAVPDSWGSDGLDFDTDVTPLMRAADKGDLDAVRRLLAEGAEVNARDWMGRTALLHACVHGGANPLVIAALLAAGADANAQDKGGTTALKVVAMGEPGPNRTSALRELLAAGADAKGKDRNGGTALMSAAAGGDVETVRLLLEAGADVTAQAQNGQTALSLARQNHHPAVVQLLEQAGARGE